MFLVIPVGYKRAILVGRAFKRARSACPRDFLDRFASPSNIFGRPLPSRNLLRFVPRMGPAIHWSTNRFPSGLLWVLASVCLFVCLFELVQILMCSRFCVCFWLPVCDFDDMEIYGIFWIGRDPLQNKTWSLGLSFKRGQTPSRQSRSLKAVSLHPFHQRESKVICHTPKNCGFPKDEDSFPERNKNNSFYLYIYINIHTCLHHVFFT